MLELQGIAVSPGVAIGRALILDREGYRITKIQINSDDREAEVARLQDAIDAASEELDQRKRDSSDRIGQHVGEIFSAHQQLLLDPMLSQEWVRGIRERCISAEYSVSSVLSRYAQAFRRMGGSTMRERVQDIRDVERTLLEALGGAPLQTSHGEDPAILLSHDLTPRETADLDRDRVLGFCTEVGGPSSHTAIVARGLEIPAVVGVGNFLHRLESDCLLIVDGHRGRIIASPNDSTIEEYRQRQADRDVRAEKLVKIRDLPAETRDGERIKLLANIELPHEVPAGLARGAEGVGLYRTEFLYLGSETEPTEEELFTSYADVMRLLDGRPIVMRTQDLGADKAPTLSDEPENNPFLGLRSIRLSLRRPQMFRTQLRAMLRAAALGPLQIMFPMVTSMHELRTARMMLRQVMDDLEEEGESVPAQIEVGMMVEVPAAVVMLERFMDEIDFASIGTNDLIQYTMAVDRGNENVADLYAGHDPAVIRMLKMALDVGHRVGKEVSICGEMSSKPSTALMLVGLGARKLSAPPAALPQVKQAIRSVTLQDCQEIGSRIFEFDTAREVDAYLQHRFAELVPEMALGV